MRAPNRHRATPDVAPLRWRRSSDVFYDLHDLLFEIEPTISFSRRSSAKAPSYVVIDKSSDRPINTNKCLENRARFSTSSAGRRDGLRHEIWRADRSEHQEEHRDVRCDAAG